MMDDRARQLRLAGEILGLISTKTPDGEWLHSREDVDQLVAQLALFLAKSDGWASLPGPVRARLDRLRAELEPGQQLSDYLSSNPVSGDLRSGLARLLREEAQMGADARELETGAPTRTTARPDGNQDPGGRGVLARIKADDWD